MEALFKPYEFAVEQRAELDRDGHFVLPGLLTEEACGRLTEALTQIQAMPRDDEEYLPSRFSAEYNIYLESLIAHPQMLQLVRDVLGAEIRYDHCVALNRAGGNGGSAWHSHEYAEDDPSLGFLRVFFYVNGFQADDGGLKVVRGSHLHRDAGIRAESDEELLAGWMADKVHPKTGEALAIEELSVPRGTVVLMWTHAAHGVNGRKMGSDTRWCVVYAYRNPGRTSRARWLSEGFEQKGVVGAEGLMSLY
ncbi:MAG TPA: hypothetical protein EYG11_15510 [Candidatus Latescibacteria bacterium]|nr:hypothetical protein [Candidatus Handelsmanbacteria bacterium]HIL10105.1 hypothetical protein [Candidatus Latescibacterota bacterium]